MKKTMSLAVVMAAIFTIAISRPALGDTIFVGSSSAGVRQLEENLKTSAYNDVGKGVKHLAISSDAQRLYCAASSSQKIAILDAEMLAEIKTIDIPGEIRAMEFANGALYVLAAGNPGRLLVISDASQEITAEIEVGINPLDMVVTSDGSKLFVAKGGESKIDVISAERGEVVSSIDCGGNPCSLVLSGDENKLYAADSASSEVIVIDAQANNVLKRIAAGEKCVRLYPAGGNIYAIDNSSAAKAVYVIDTSSDALIETIELDNVPYSAASHPNGDYSIIVSHAGNKAYKIDSSFRVIAETPMPNALSALVIDETLSKLSTLGIIYMAGSPVEINNNKVMDIEVLADSTELHATSDYVVVITAPNGGEEWSAANSPTGNGKHKIEWDVPVPGPGVGVCNLYYSSTGYGGPFNNLIVSGILDIDGQFSWNLTTVKDNPSNQYFVSIQCQIPGGTSTMDLSDGAFIVDNRPPLVNIIDPPQVDYTIAPGTASIDITVEADDGYPLGTPPYIQDPLEVVVQGNATTYYANNTTGNTYVATGVPITGGGVQNLITVTAYDNLDNAGTDKISAFEGWIGHVEFPGNPEDYIIANDYNSSGAATCQMILDLMRQGAPGSPDLPIQNNIYTTGHAFNQNQTIFELDPWGVDGALDELDPWDPGYNFDVSTYEAPDGFMDYIRDISHWIAYQVPGVTNQYTPVVVPKHGYTLKPFHWVAINGVAAEEDPYTAAGEYAVYGMWVTDPEGANNIGRDQYLPAATLETLLEPAPLDYVSIIEPPEDIVSEARINPPRINESTLALVDIAEYFNSADKLEKHLVDSALIVDLEEAQPIVHYSLGGDLLNLFSPEGLENSPTICWKDIIDPMLLTDEGFRAAINGAIARDFLYVTRLDTGEKYILIPFDKFAQGEFLSYAAIMVDRELGYFKQASWVEEPARYIQISKEDAMARVIELYPEAASKNPEARLVWKPSDISSSPFYPYWEIIAGEDKYYVIEK